jgi:two-component system nitrogen regulation sensor histidine kinase NtrY
VNNPGQISFPKIPPQKKMEADPVLRKKTKRKWLIIMGVVAMGITLAIIQSLVHELKNPSDIRDNIRLYLLLNFNLLVVLGLIILVVRNLIKLYLERRRNVLGTRFRSKLIFVFILISFIPTTLLFLVSSNVISTTIDNWFNTQNEESLKTSLEVAQTYYELTLGNAFDSVKSLSRIIADQDLLEQDRMWLLEELVRKRQREARVGVVRIVAADGREILDLANPWIRQSRFIAPVDNLIKKGMKGGNFSFVRMMDEGDLIDGVVPILSGPDRDRVEGVILFNYFDSKKITVKINDIKNAYEEYTRRKIFKDPLKTTYLMVDLVATLLILFAMIWFGIQLAKGITVPFQSLVQGTQEVAAGNLDYKVNVKADDEINILVDSFNQMTGDLKSGKIELEKANVNLKKTNIELDQRRAYMETVLENIATGVVSIDPDGKINTINKAGASMLDLDRVKIRKRLYQEVFTGFLSPLGSLIEEMEDASRSQIRRSLTLLRTDQTMTILASISSIRDTSRVRQGMVLVFDDMTQLIKAQKATAWKEVARRIAHEVKNPLTPIQLNIQRLRKKFQNRSSDLDKVFDESTKTIISEVKTLKNLVNEFSRFARMPQVKLKPSNLNKIIENAVALYAGHPNQIEIITKLDSKIPVINLDADQIKRVFINLIDNAAAASNGGQNLWITTLYDKQFQLVTIEVADEGCGIPPEDKSKLFLPYFSTRKSGTGLGLAIVSEIISDHKGYIRVQNNHPRGTIFTIEIPVS